MWTGMNSELQAAFAADDEARAAHERWEYKQRQRMIRRDASTMPDLIYKTNENALQPAPHQQQSAASTEWATRAYVDQAVDILADIAGSEDGKLERELRAAIKTEREDVLRPAIAEALSTRICDLRDELRREFADRSSNCAMNSAVAAAHMDDNTRSVRQINDALLACPMPDRMAALACAVITDEANACDAVCALISVSGALARQLPPAARLAIAWHMLEEIQAIGAK